MLSPGQTVTLTYPDCTLIESLARLRDRRVHVVAVRDLIAEPLTPAEFLRRPLIRRSRYLVTGWDTRARSMRQFYLGSSRQYEAPGVLRIAVYRPGESQPYDLVGRGFGPTRRDRQTLSRCLAEMRGRQGNLRLRVLADDLGVVA